MKMLDSFEIKNQCSIEKISPTYKDKLKTAGELLKAHKDIIKAAYLIGSLGRGEYQEGYSDIGIIIVADKKNKVCIDALKKIFPRKRLVINIFTVDEFFSEKHKKDRFIIQTDGILLWGQDLVSKEKFPKPGLKLALLLNEDLLEKIEAAVTWIKSNPHVGPTEISIKSRTMAKDIINFIYGVVISNKPQFTHNRQERIQKINAMYPENKNTLDTLMQITKYGVGDMSSFITLTDGFKSRVLDNLKRMNFVCAELDKKSK
jgi:predicted nucleotidyltransferase